MDRSKGQSVSDKEIVQETVLDQSGITDSSLSGLGLKQSLDHYLDGIARSR